MKHIKSAMAMSAMIALAACGSDTSDDPTLTQPGATANQQTTAAAVVTRTQAANTEQCAAGGTQIELGLDTNGNATLDDSEVTSTQLICNGTNGASSILLVEPATAEQCPAGGHLVLSGIDANADGKLTEGENPTTAIICNGSDGASGDKGDKGDQGEPGKNGLNTVINLTPLPANDADCKNGGHLITSGLDADNDGIADPATATTAKVCNGQDGTNGKDGKDGTNGKDGKDGANGKDGTNGQDGQNGTDANALISVSNPVVIEGEQATFTITLNQALPVDTSFFFTTQNVNAVAGEDYTPKAGKLDFAAEGNQAIVTVPVNTDTHFEDDEYFTLQVTGAGTLATGVAKITQPSFFAQPLTVRTNANGNALVGTDVVIELSDQLNDIAADGITVTSAEGITVGGMASYELVAGTPTLSFTPSASLALGTTYTVSLKPVTTLGQNEEKTLADVGFTTESQAFAYRNEPAESLANVSNLWQWLEEGTAREIKAGSAPLTFAGHGIAFSGQYYFAGSDVTGATQADSQLYISDGSSHGTHLLTDAESNPVATNPDNFTVFNGELYFTANNATGTAQQLWKTDGTVATTVAIAGTEAAEISELTVVGETLYYVVDASTLWSIDVAGSAAELASAGNEPISYVGQLTSFNAAVYFVGFRNGKEGSELFTISESAISLSLELNGKNFASSNFQNLQVIGEQLFFTAEPSSGGRFAYLYDGVNTPSQVAGGFQVFAPAEVGLSQSAELILDQSNRLKDLNSGIEVAAFNSTTGLINTPAGVVVAGSVDGTQGLWLFTDATPLENGAAPTIAIATGSITLEGLVGDKLLYSVEDNSQTTYYLTDLVTLDADTQEVKVIAVSNERAVL